MAAKTVVAGVERDLAAIAKIDAALANSALATTALMLAESMDDPGNSATSKSMCARALVDVLEQLRELTPEGEQKDGVDDLSARRARRLGGAASAS